MKKTMIFAMMAAALTSAAAIGAYSGSPEAKRYITDTKKGKVEIVPFSNDIFRIVEASNDFPSTPKLPVSSPTVSDIHSWTSGNEYVVESPTTRVVVDRLTGRVTFFNSQGEVLLSEAEGVVKDGEEQTATFLTPDGDNFYGAGEKGHSMTLNGSDLLLYNRANYGYGEGDSRLNQANINIPYIVSDSGYGLLMDDYAKSKFTIGNDTITYRTISTQPLSYYFINGDGTLAGATESYMGLVGKQPLPPFWTLGYITSKYGYHSEKEASGAIDTLKQHEYPVDGIVLDLYWYGMETDMGRLEWDKEHWPNHKKMLEDLNSLGVHVIPIHQPYINKIGAIDNYNVLDSKGLLTKDANGVTKDVTTWVGEAGMFDISNPDTREWMWNRLSTLTAEGLSGWWGDLGEPEVHPIEIVHANGETAEEYHNYYGNEWSKMIYEGLQRDFPNMRPMLMMRGGTTGLQQYSVFPWTSDVARSWEGLQAQNKLMLSSGLSGLGYMSNDVGGFAIDKDHPYDPELYVRWIQAGTFSPVLRTHAQDKPEPYHYPKQESIIKKFINTRYQWLPYNYTLAYENTTKGYPLMRQVNFNGDNEDCKYAHISDEYLWGDEVLVAPVMTKGATTRKVEFPAGEWIDWNNPLKTYHGGTTATVSAPLSTLPMFIRAGSFIPQYMKKMNNTSEYDPAQLTVKYFPSAEWTEYLMYDDNRISPTSLEDGEYQLTTFSGCKQGNEINVEISSESSYKEMPTVRMITLEIINVAKPKEVEINGEAIKGYGYDAATKTLSIDMAYKYQNLELKIKN